MSNFKFLIQGNHDTRTASGRRASEASESEALPLAVARFKSPAGPG
jgi:hypothetical protein